MSEPITLPADTVWPTPTLGVAIVQGDEQWASEFPDATVEFVAPQAWAQYDKPCDPSVSVRRDGRQVWTVRWPCDCDRRLPMTDHYTEQAHTVECIAWRGGPGRSARATIQVAPVVGKPSDSPAQACLSPLTRGMAMLWHDRIPIDAETSAEELHGRSQLVGPLDPLPTPGESWAVIVRLVAE